MKSGEEMDYSPIATEILRLFSVKGKIRKGYPVENTHFCSVLKKINSVRINYSLIFNSVSSINRFRGNQQRSASGIPSYWNEMHNFAHGSWQNDRRLVPTVHCAFWWIYFCLYLYEFVSRHFFVKFIKGRLFFFVLFCTQQYKSLQIEGVLDDGFF